MCQECPAQCAAVAWQDSGVVVHEGLQRLGLRLHGSKRLIGKLSKGFDFLGYRVVPGRRLRSSAESNRRFAEKFRRLYEQGASSMRLWRYAQGWWRWHRAGLDGRVALKGGMKRVIIRQLRMLGIVGFPIPTYDAQTGRWQMQKVLFRSLRLRSSL
ncbi:MAG: hypothetical protein VYA08_09410 [Pseudomonadota bacterium]|nr:hypothetical protein [Pseudomonadota bacterium]